jgi:quinol monooxygenase YgiN
MPDHSVRVIATFLAQPGKAAALAAHLAQLIEPTRAEEGCLRYELWQSETDVQEFRFVEEWTSADALAAHLQTPHILSGREGLSELLAGELDIRTYRLVG